MTDRTTTDERALLTSHQLLQHAVKGLRMQDARLHEGSRPDPFGGMMGKFVDTHYYLVSAVQIRRAFILAANAGSEAAVEALDQLHALPEFPLMRNVIEHLEHYALGEGDDQPKKTARRNARRGEAVAPRVSEELEYIIKLNYVDSNSSAPRIEIAGRTAIVDHMTPALAGLAENVMVDIVRIVTEIAKAENRQGRTLEELTLDEENRSP